MAYGYGFTDVALVSSGGQLDSGNIVRVFDVAMASTSNAVNIIQLFNGVDISQNQFLTVNSANVNTFNSNAGIRFSKGCFVVATGCTAMINFIREF
jgi:hypothetical protein